MTLPKNIIFMVSDGMSVSMASAYRELLSRREGGYHKPCIFNHHLLGQQSTYSNDPNETITDSGASSTAMATGVKTINGYIGLDEHKNRVESALEVAKRYGKKTGICVTAEITHATPAGFAAHVENRMDYSTIADQYFDERINEDFKIDVMVGGGRSHFNRSDRDLMAEFQEAGFDVVHTLKDLQKSQNSQVLALLSEFGLPFALDRDYRTMPRLKDMVEESIRLLNQDNDQGFFLMVEGSQIDWGGHFKDVVTVMGEIHDYAEAFEAAIDFAREDGQTLVISTSDHATGGMTMGANDIASWYPHYIEQVKFTPDFIANDIILRNDLQDSLGSMIGFELSSTEYNELYAAHKDYHKSAESIKDTIKHQLREIVDRRSNTGWTTGNHTGEDVNIYAYGPGKDLWAGWRENTETGQLLKKLAAGKID